MDVAVPLELLERFVDDTTCYFDHDGNCQAHDNVLEPGEVCPNERLKRLIAAAT